MGSPASEPGRENLGCGVQGSDSDEVQHQVQLTKEYYTGIFEVTQAQYAKIVGTVNYIPNYVIFEPHK